MNGSGHRKPLLALVEKPSSGADADFDYRFYEDRVRRWLNGVSNGISFQSMMRLRFGKSGLLNFKGTKINVSDDRVIMGMIEDIWMRGEYDVPGFIPQEGWRVIDIGGNVGIFALLAASRGAFVETYEPHPGTFQKLCSHALGWNVTCHNAAVVGLCNGSVCLYVHERHTRNSIVRPPQTTSEAAAEVDSIRVPSVSIAEVLAHPCDLLKVDCEGGEFNLFAAVGGQLRNAKRIIAEIHTEMGDTGKLLQDVRRSGFHVSLADENHKVPFRILTAVRVGS